MCGCVRVRLPGLQGTVGGRPGRGPGAGSSVLSGHAPGDEGVGLPWSRRSRRASQGRGDSGADLLAGLEVGVGQGSRSTGLGKASGWAGRGSALGMWGWGRHRACCRGRPSSSLPRAS